MSNQKFRLSKRLPKDLTPSPFFEELEKAKAEALASGGLPFIDMTVSSPVRVGLPVELDSAVDEARKFFGHWSPDAAGWREAREAVARYYQERGGVFTANQIIVTASTSEAYSVLFKTFCNPGDVILTPMPGYPLLDTLAQLEHLECAPYFLKLVRESSSHSCMSSSRLDMSSSHSCMSSSRLDMSSSRMRGSSSQIPGQAGNDKMQAEGGNDKMQAEGGNDKEQFNVGNDKTQPDAGNDKKQTVHKSQKSFRFVLDTDSFLTAPENAKILLLVSPHNPTGHIVSLAEWNETVRFCEENGLILVVDEVFGDYGFSHEVRRSWQYLRRDIRSKRPKDANCAGDVRDSLAENADFFDCGNDDIVFAPADGPKCPIFWLNGLSKAVGAPQLKFGWMAFYAPREQFEEIRAALEFVEDAYLSASSCAQALAAPLLAKSGDYESQVTDRLMQNWETLQAAFPSKYCPKVLGGWYAVLHLGDDDEELTLQLLREKHVLVQPGFFFDFEEDGWVVVSLLQEPNVFAEAVNRMKKI